jgi:hypothetical protein
VDRLEKVVYGTIGLALCSLVTNIIQIAMRK